MIDHSNWCTIKYVLLSHSHTCHMSVAGRNRNIYDTQDCYTGYGKDPQAPGYGVCVELGCARYGFVRTLDTPIVYNH